MTEKKEKYDLVIIGAGPAGLTASIYASRFGINHLVIGSLIEGRLAEANEVGNFPPDTEISGQKLIKKMEEHAKNLNVEIKSDKVTKISKNNKGFLIETMTGKEYFTKTLLLAIGAERKKLNIPEEEKFSGKGISYCATCDGKIFTNKVVAIVGGSSATATTADYLSDLAETVYLIHGGAKLKADKIWQERINKNPKIKTISDNQIKGLEGGNFLETAILEKDYQGKKELKVDGIFVEMGIAPNLEIINELGVEKDENGFINIKSDGSTNIEGVWAAGDITNGSNNFRQIVTANAEGAIAASSIHPFLKKQNN